MRFVFDLDECLVATRVAHTRAWEAAGVTPPDPWLPARLWPQPPTDEQRAQKDKLFPAMLEENGDLLPLMKRVQPGDHVLTGTSRASLRILKQKFPILNSLVFHPMLGPDEKIHLFKHWTLRGEVGIYFDDWPEFVARVNEETKWTAVQV